MPFSMLIIGSTGSGKSYFLKYLILDLVKKKEINYIVVFTSTKHQGFEYIPSSFIHANYSDRKLRKILKQQKTEIEKGKQMKCLLVFDDILGSVNFNSKLFQKFITQFRHYNCSVAISTQYIAKIPTIVRENANYSVIFQQHIDRSFKAIYESYFMRLGLEYPKFKKWLNERTENYSFVFVDNKEKSKDISKIYKVLRAPSSLPDIRLVY